MIVLHSHSYGNHEQGNRMKYERVLAVFSEYMTKIDNISDVNLSAVEDIGNIVFKSISTALNVTLLYFCHVLNLFLGNRESQDEFYD